MKKLLLTLTVVLVGAVAAIAQNGPKITFKESMFDYGNIPHNVPASHEFVFTNTGNAPLIITNAKAGCGCTTPDYPKEPIQPGKTGIIKVTYNAATMGGFTKTVTVDSNGGQITLTIKGTVVEKAGQATPPVVNPNK